MSEGAASGSAQDTVASGAGSNVSAALRKSGESLDQLLHLFLGSDSCFLMLSSQKCDAVMPALGGRITPECVLQRIDHGR